MKNEFIKGLCTILIISVVSTIIPYKVNAKEESGQAINCNYNIEHYKTKEEGKFKDSTEPLGKLNEPQISTFALTQNYTMKDLNKLSYKDLIDTISAIEWYNITDLFQYNSDAYEFYSNTSRMDALILALKEKGEKYTATDSLGIKTLVEVIRAGFYLGYYNDELKELNKRSYHDKCIPAMLAIENNKNFKLGEIGQNEVIDALGMLIGNGSCNNEVINKTIPILKDFNNNFESYSGDYYKGNGVYQLIKGIEYDVTEYAYDAIVHPNETPFFGKIDGYIDEIKEIALYGKVTEGNAWIINNGIYYLSRLSKYYSKPEVQRGNVEKAMQIYEYLGEQYLLAVQRIMYGYDGELLNGTFLDYNKIVEDGKSYYLPRTYTFDDGKMIIKAGNKVSEEKIKRLYWASKEVNSQFFRVLGSDTPLEVGNTDDILTMVIYNSPKEYSSNSVLYGLSTDNGGIYIEGDGAFYTYERTEEESIFSLEELFRHEYTHYLQGRYLVPGLWGTSDFYKGNPYRITWFEEGSAEFFAGSTRKENILPRQSIVSGLSWSPEERFTADELFKSDYSGWDFYNYGFAFSNYIYNENKDILNKLLTYMKTNNVKGYDDYINILSKDENINLAYQNHMQKLVDSYNDLTVPLVSDDYIVSHSEKGLYQIKDEIVASSNIKNAVISEARGQYGGTFTLKGTYTGTTSKGATEDWNTMNKKANEILMSLDKLSWNGYKTVTCYFTNYKVNTSNKYQYDIVFTGVSNDNEVSFKKEDVNTDGNIDLVDLSTVAVRYNGEKGDKVYDSFVDVNVDNIIDIYDIVKVAKSI